MIKINKIFFVLFITVLFFFGTTLSAQQSDEKNKTAVPDTINKHSSQNPFTEFSIKFQNFEFYRDLNQIKMNIPIDGDPATVWLRTSIALSNFNQNTLNSETPSNLLSPLYQQYLEKSRFDPVRYVLGLAQASAVGYLAYKHIKKYGFLK